MDATRLVFWAVIAVIATAPCTPSEANALRSACSPAPPDESEPAMVMATSMLGNLHGLIKDHLPSSRISSRQCLYILSPFESTMKATSGHFILDDTVEYKDLAEVFPELLTTFLEETNQLPDDDDVLQMFIYLNQRALDKNEKPEGYNRKGRMRMVFPIGSNQFYIKSVAASTEVGRMGEKLSKILANAGVKHSLEWNALGAGAD